MAYSTDSRRADGQTLEPGGPGLADFVRRRVRVALARIRWQILGGLALAVALPALCRWPVGSLTAPAASLNNAVIGTAFALVFGYAVLRKLAGVPGLQTISYILPVFSVSYGLVAVILLVSRQDYSSTHLLASFFVAVGFFYVAFLTEQRVKRPRLAVVTGGHTEELVEFRGVDWVTWPSPAELPRGCHGVVADLRADRGEDWSAFLARCALNGIPVYHSKQVQESLTGRVAIEHLSENTLGSLNPSSIYVQLKLALDLAVAVLVLPFAAVICAIAAIFIKLESPGPVLFVQERIGYRGQPFRAYKLRTMKSTNVGAPYTESNDRRITQVGAFLRTYRIDELPQIINILKGEMSWIGPRPEARTLSEWYERELVFYSYRHIVRPGITGWAQVQQGNVARPETVKYKLHYDFYYIKNFSLWLDLVIFAQSIRIILTGFGAR